MWDIYIYLDSLKKKKYISLDCYERSYLHIYGKTIDFYFLFLIKYEKWKTSLGPHHILLYVFESSAGHGVAAMRVTNEVQSSAGQRTKIHLPEK